ncbi:MAG TPA: bifunctional alpha/beta hydrolase/class I SAM-dependent methyltransferase [Burkholderiales bacterium]|nr:bifunctional alpha/beta hydrolase/class I SAM-dependent methyltransferase [Burkholderiales bacterium]
MRRAEERTFTTHDGTALFYRHWPAEGAKAERAIVLFHRGHEHSGRLQHIVDELELPDCAMFAWDARGHGRSPGARGDSPAFAASVKDVDAFVRHVAQAYGLRMENIAVIAQSVGAVLVSTWAHDYAPRVRCLVLAAPAFKVRLYVPFARAGLALLYRLRGNFFVNSYVKAKFLTHDPERIRSYESDPLITRPISVRMLLALYEAAERVVADARAIVLPVQLLVSGADWVVHTGPQYDFFERLGSVDKERHVLPGFFHDTLGERDRAVAFDRIRGFLARHFGRPAQAPALLEAHRAGYTLDEEARLSRPLPALSPKGLMFAAVRLSMRTLGRLSDGVRLGLATGFDSGSMMDYVYRDRAGGITPLGRLIDRNYLNAIGWRGIRVRKQHLERAIAAAAARLRAAGRPVRIADIAAGHGRYVLEALDKLEAPPEAILLRDYSDLNVRDGEALIADKGLERVARFEKADAFDEEGVARLQPRPSIAVVSGLYELFPDNDQVLASLRGLARAVESGGYLIYTGQPWHPQLELIARTLTSHRGGQAWVMRRRTQAEMDALVRQAGFEKLEQWTDDWGIFTVSLAGRG